jgi:hypothetical protein
VHCYVVGRCKWLGSVSLAEQVWHSDLMFVDDETEAHELSAPWVTVAVCHFSRLLGIMGRKLEMSVRPQDGNICCTRNDVIASSSRLLAFLFFPLAANMLVYSGITAHPETIPASAMVLSCRTQSASTNNRVLQPIR